MLSGPDRIARNGLDWLCAAQWRAVLAIILVGLAVIVPGLSDLPPTDRDESRYVMASIQMMESGDYIDIRNQDKPRWKKPVGIYWLQVAAAKLTGTGADAPIWVFRLPSLLGIILAGVCTFWAFRPSFGAKTALLAGLILITSFDAVFEGHIAKTDAMLLGMIMAAQGALFRITKESTSSFGLIHGIFWVALAAGILIKGPLILIPVLATLLGLFLFDRDLRIIWRLKPIPGLALMLALVLPWFIAIGVQSDWAFYAESVGKDLVGKIGEEQERHGGPIGYYLLSIWLFFWPWAPLLFLAMPALWHLRKLRIGVALAAWIFPLWLLFEFTSTKLPHYVLPLYPALALLIAHWVLEGPKDQPLWQRLLVVPFAVLSGSLVLVLCFDPALILNIGRDADDLIALHAATPVEQLKMGLMAVLLLISLYALLRGKRVIGALLLMISATFSFAEFYDHSMPRQHTMFPSETIARVYHSYHHCTDQPLYSVGYTEPSLIVRAGTDTRLASLKEAQTAPDGTIIALSNYRGKQAIETEGLKALPGAEWFVQDGFNYNRNKHMTTRFYIRAGDETFATCTHELSKAVLAR